MHSSPTRGGKRPRAQASPKRERPPAPTTEDGWAKLKHDEILRERDSYGEHVKNHQGLARFYRSTEEYKGNGFLEYALAEHERAAILGQESKTIGKRSATRLSGSEEERAKEEKRIGEKAEKKAMDAILLGEQREEASVGYSKLYAKYRMTLSECVQRYNAAHPAEEELKPEVADQVFKSEAGKASAKWWNVWRELEHRKEVRSKLLTGSLDRVRDPIGQQFANFMLPDNTTIPVGDFISSLAVKRSRPSGKGVQAGKSRYTTAKGNPNQTLLLGNCKVASKEWEPVPAYLIKALEPAIKAYEKAHVYYHDTYLKVTDQYRTLAREHGAALDLCHARVVDPARAGDRRQEGAAKRVDIALLTPLDDVGQHATDEEHMIHEELQCLQEIWRQFGLVVSGVCKAAIDWHYEIIAHMMNTEAMVMCYDCPYSPPSELTFRDLVNDHMSYAPAEALRAIKGGLFVGVKPENVLASDGEPHCRAYTIHGRVHRVLPYAAVLAPDTMQLLVNFSVMRLYHNAVYRDVAYKLKLWHYNGMAGGGFCDINSINRRQNTDDVVFGMAGPNGSLALVEPKPTFNGLVTQHKRWRYRRVQGDECGLPPTDYPFVSEYKWTLSSGEDVWLTWTKGAFYAEQSPLHWAPLPQNENGEYRPLGWMQGDDPPAPRRGDKDGSRRDRLEWERSKEYGVADSAKLLPRRSELPPMFDEGMLLPARRGELPRMI